MAVLIAAALGVRFPEALRQVRPATPWLLGGVILLMGFKLSRDDFERVFRAPRGVICGVTGQFVIMPTLGFLAARFGAADPGTALGFVLLGACPSATAAIILSDVAAGDVALTTSITVLTTLLSVGLTPWLMGRLRSGGCPSMPRSCF